MAKILITYPLDLKGNLLSNSTTHEFVLGVGNHNRAFAYPTGPFYANSFRITEVNTPNTPLVRGKDYQLLLLHPDLTKLCKQEIACGVVVYNPNVSTDVTTTAQVVGGPHAANVVAIEQAINSLDLDNRQIDFSDLSNVPDEYATAPAYSDIGDIYGFEYIITILAQMTDVMKVSDSVAVKQLEQVIADMRKELQQMFQQHIDSDGNVHNLTRAQISVYSTSQVDEEIQKVMTVFNNLSLRIGGLESEDVALNKKLEAINLSLSNYTQQLVLIRQNYQRTNQNVADLSAQVSQYESQVAQLQQTVLDLTQQLADTNRELSDTKNIVEQHTGQITAILEEIQKIKQDLVSGNDNLNKHINAEVAHAQYLDKNKGGTVHASVHVVGLLTSTDDVQADV